MMDEGENGKARTDPSKLLCRWASYDAIDELATPPAEQLAEQRAERPDSIARVERGFAKVLSQLFRYGSSVSAC